MKLSKADDYELIRTSVIEKVHERIAERHMSLAEAQLELSADLTEELRSKKGTLDARDLSTSIRNLDVGSGIHTDKASALRDGLQPKPTQIDFQASLQALVDAGATSFKLVIGREDEQPEQPAIEGTANEVDPEGH